MVGDEELNVAADGIEEAIRWSTVGIVSGSGHEKWKGIGTGTLIRWKAHHFILTAEHVIARTVLEDLRFFSLCGTVVKNNLRSGR